MVSIVRRVSLVATALMLLSVSSASAIPTEKHDTTIKVKHVEVSPQGRLTVDGLLRSDGRTCRGIPVYLRKRHSDEFPIDVGFASLPHGAWITRSDPGAVDGSTFFVATSREVITSVTVHGNHKHIKRLICRADRAPVELPGTAQP